MTAPAPGEHSLLTAAERERYHKIEIKEGFASRVFFGLLGSAVVYGLMNFGGIKWVVIHLIALVLGLFGKEWYDVSPKDAAAQAASELAKKAMGHLPIIGIKTPEQLEAERKQQLAEMRADAEAIGMPYDPTWPPEKLKAQLRVFLENKRKAEKAEREQVAAKKRQEEKDQAAREKAAREAEEQEQQRAEESAERAALVARATLVKFGVDKTLPLREMKHQVEQVEDYVEKDADFQLKHRQWEGDVAEYWDRVENGKNGACPNCRFEVHVGPNRPYQSIMCPACKGMFPRSAFKQMMKFPPPPREPQPTAKKPGFLNLFFD